MIYLNCIQGGTDHLQGGVKLTSLNLVAASLCETLVPPGILVPISGYARSYPSMVLRNRRLLTLTPHIIATFQQLRLIGSTEKFPAVVDQY